MQASGGLTRIQGAAAKAFDPGGQSPGRTVTQGIRAAANSMVTYGGI